MLDTLSRIDATTGKMLFASIVGKEKARKAFETEVRAVEYMFVVPCTSFFTRHGLSSSLHDFCW